MINQVTPNVAEKHIASIGNKASTEDKYVHQQYLHSLSLTAILTTRDNPGTGSLHELVFLLIPSVDGTEYGRSFINCCSNL